MKARQFTALVMVVTCFSNFAWANKVTCFFGSKEPFGMPLFTSEPVELLGYEAKIHVFLIHKEGGDLHYVDEREYLLSHSPSAAAEVSVVITKSGVRYEGRWDSFKNHIRGNGYVPFAVNKNGKYEASPLSHLGESNFVGDPLELSCIMEHQEPQEGIPSAILNRKFKALSCSGTYLPNNEALFMDQQIKSGTVIQMVSSTVGSAIFKIDSAPVELWNFDLYGYSKLGRERRFGELRTQKYVFEYSLVRHYSDYLHERTSRGSQVHFKYNPASAQPWQLVAGTSLSSNVAKDGGFYRHATCNLEEIP